MPERSTETTILWADPEHLWGWETHFSILERKYGYKITKLPSAEQDRILKRLNKKDAVVIHCGTIHPMADLKVVIEAIKSRYPEIKVGLETNVLHPAVSDLVDFYVDKPISIGDLHELLQTHIKPKK